MRRSAICETVVPLSAAIWMEVDVEESWVVMFSCRVGVVVARIGMIESK